MSPRNRDQERGFTLIELLVASAAGLFVVLAAFMLSRGATRIFAGEGRVASSQLNLRVGVDRMRADLERAAFMSTPHVVKDPEVCPNPNTGGATVRLQSVFYERGVDGTGATDAPQSAAQGLSPDRITIGGNFTTTDLYLAADIALNTAGTGFNIVLQQRIASSARLMALGETGDPSETIKSIFGAGRLVRVRNALGVSQYLIIASAAIDASGRPVIVTTNMPKYHEVSGAIARCGGSPPCHGCEINPVSLVRYSLRSLRTTSGFGWAYTDAGGVGSEHKYDLVRTELNPDGTEMNNASEIVAEYGVDLAFAFTVDDTASLTPGATWTEPNLKVLPFGHAENLDYGGSIIASANNRPQRIRAIRYRFTTRTQIPEYQSGADDGGPGLMRYQLGTNRYARARTVAGEVVLHNQGGLRW